MDITHIFHCKVRVIAPCLWFEKSKYFMMGIPEKRHAH
jgi:hypothetical protein